MIPPTATAKRERSEIHLHPDLFHSSVFYNGNNSIRLMQNCDAKLQARKKCCMYRTYKCDLQNIKKKLKLKLRVYNQSLQYLAKFDIILTNIFLVIVLVFILDNFCCFQTKYSQTCLQRPPV